MTLQQPQPIASGQKNSKPILCKKCGVRIVFSKDHIAPSGRKIPLDPFFNNSLHAPHCIYAGTKNQDPDTESLLLNFLSKIPKKKRVIGAVGRAKN